MVMKIHSLRTAQLVAAAIHGHLLQGIQADAALGLLHRPLLEARDAGLPACARLSTHDPAE